MNKLNTEYAANTTGCKLSQNCNNSNPRFHQVKLEHYSKCYAWYCGVGTYLRGTARAVPLLKVGRLK